MVKDPRMFLSATSDEREAALTALGFENTEDNWEQLSYFAEAMRLYEKRGKKYGDAWKDYGFQDCMFHCRSKMKRLGAVLQNIAAEVAGDLEIDDGIDLLNYAVFAMRNAMARNAEGERRNQVS